LPLLPCGKKGRLGRVEKPFETALEWVFEEGGVLFFDSQERLREDTRPDDVSNILREGRTNRVYETNAG
jgi:hypothetical protein